MEYVEGLLLMMGVVVGKSQCGGHKNFGPVLDNIKNRRLSRNNQKNPNCEWLGYS